MEERPLLLALLRERCLLCGERLAAAPYPVCTPCVAALPLLRDACCPGCGVPLVCEHERCPRCRTRSVHFDSVTALFEYRGPARELLYQYKFRGRRRLARLFAELMSDAIGDRYPSRLLVPTPGRKSVMRRRGWDHVQELARRLERDHDANVVSCLRRSRGAAQKTLSFSSRLANLRGRIQHTGGPGGRNFAPVLLDDLMTTGATADECARILKGHGAVRVDVIVLAVDL
jgi:ComF family protein